MTSIESPAIQLPLKLSNVLDSAPQYRVLRSKAPVSHVVIIVSNAR